MMKLFSGILMISILTLGISTTSCVKKCTINKEDTNAGAIISEKNGELVVIYPSGGYQTSNMGGDYHIHAGSQYDDRYEVSFDGGKNKGPVDYNVYNILAFPVNVSCEASFDRNVTIDATSQTITYSLVVTACKNCNENYLVENYVLIPKVPASYTVIYDLSFNEVES